MGGTRFVGPPLVSRLQSQGHLLTLFTRGQRPLPSQVEHIRGDRGQDKDLSLLENRRFDVVVDTSGRTLEDTQRVLKHCGLPRHRLLYVSSAGVYATSDSWPLDEESTLDPSSRHSGKAETEAWLREQGIPFTSFRPTYIVGPGNYNPIERWFFERIIHNQPVPLPGDGTTITQIGHVDDLAEAMARSLEVDLAVNRIYNCSSRRGTTFRGLIQAAARACGRDPADLQWHPFDPSSLDLLARKKFPLRLSHFLVDISRVERELDWQPRYDTQACLSHSYLHDKLYL